MRPGIWLIITLAAVVAIGVLVLAVNIVLDIYGLFRHPRGRQLPAYGDERIAKYLLCGRYVPANLNALLIGSSVTGNWNAGRIKTLRAYNTSVNAANVVEERSMVELAIAKRGILVALLLVHPYLMESHEFKAVSLAPREKIAALGSLSLWTAYKQMTNVRLAREHQSSDGFGTNLLDWPKRPFNPTLKRMVRSGTDFDIDRIAFAAYQATVSELHAHGVQIVFMVPPLAEGMLATNRDAFRKHLAPIQPLMGRRINSSILRRTNIPVIENAQDFSDGFHLDRGLANQVMDVIDSRLRGWLVQGLLRPLSRE